MRNLKRALSLGLTAAMISGLMVMGSSAASSSYTDVADTDNVEAINEPVGKGRFKKGGSCPVVGHFHTFYGNFAPACPLPRKTAAVRFRRRPPLLLNSLRAAPAGRTGDPHTPHSPASPNAGGRASRSPR